MAYELDVKAWLLAEKAAAHGECALELAKSNPEGSSQLQEAEQMCRTLRDDANAQFRDILWRIAHLPGAA